jgi:hypothetical protein
MHPLALILFASFYLASTLARAESTIPAEKADSNTVIRKAAEIRLGFEQTTLPGNERMGLLGASYLIEAAPSLYLGPAAYGAITGARGGFFTVGGEAAWRKPIRDQLVAAVGFYAGGGGGSGSQVGGGLMLRPHADLLWNFGGYQVGISASKVRFANGNIDSNQLGLVLSTHSDFSYFSPSLAGREVAVDGRTGVGFDRVLITAGVYRPSAGSINLGATTPSSIGYVGARFEQLFAPSLFRGIEATGAGSGGVAGYAEFLATAGAELPLWNDSLAIGTRLAMGMGGGGAVSVGGGGLAKAGAYAVIRMTPATRLALEGGYATAPGGQFRATYGSANFVWDLDHPYATGHEGTIVGNEWIFGSEHYFGAAHKDGSQRSLDAVTIKLNRFLTDTVYLTGQAHSAYNGNAGAYSAGLVGAGWRTRQFTGRYSAGAELLVGAAGGGAIDTSGGAVIQPMAYLDLNLTSTTGLRISAGRIRSLGGALNSYVLDAAVSFAFGTVSR